MLNTVLDPVGAILGAPIDWLLDWLVSRIRPVKVALDALLGDPGGVAENAERWHQCAAATTSIGPQIQPAIAQLQTWQGPAKDSFEPIHQAIVDLMPKAAENYKNFAQLSEMSGVVVATTRGFIWGEFKRAIVKAVVSALVGIINAWWSFGASALAGLANVGLQIATFLSRMAGKISELIEAASRFAKDGGRIAKALQGAAHSLKGFSIALQAGAKSPSMFKGRDGQATPIGKTQLAEPWDEGLKNAGRVTSAATKAENQVNPK